MPVEHFVGRREAIQRLALVLKGTDRAGDKLTIQSVEGPGGIGKTCLFNHVLASNELVDQKYLTLKVDGNDPSASSLVRAIPRMVDSAQAEAIRGRQAGSYFPEVDRITKAIETIRGEAIAEFQKRQPGDQEGQSALSRFLDLAFETGKRISDAVPITKKYINIREIEKSWRLLEGLVPTMVSLREETAWFWEKLGLGESTALRNSIKENACGPLSDALVSDLSTILHGYLGKDWWRPNKPKVEGIDRLLFVIDDYEKLEEALGQFLIEHFFPALRTASFQSVVVILGRDQLVNSHAAWDQHLKPVLRKPITLDPLSRNEMDELVASYIVGGRDEQDRAWSDTQGYPFYVQLWIEEIESGGRSAVMLKRFHDRTTRWMSDEQKRWLQATLFLDEVNIRTLRCMVGSAEEAKQAFRWFEREGSVRDTTGSPFRVREYLRSRLIDYIRVSDPDRYDELRRSGQQAMNGTDTQDAK